MVDFATGGVSPEEAAAEVLRRRKARNSLIGFTEYTLPKYMADPFHHMVAKKLEDVCSGKTRRLMIFAPPRHGKSELSTRRFPAYYLSHHPDRNVISASYNAEFARGFGRNVRDIISSKEYGILNPDVRIRTDNRAAEEWQLENGGTYFAVGVSTSTTGRGAHLFLIDDPIKDRKEADSQIVRDDQWNWFREVVYTRLEEDAAIVLTLTRWHFDDLAGRLIQQMNDGKGEPWDILSLPALPIYRKLQDGTPILNDDGSVPGDPLERPIDTPLAPRRFSLKALKDREEVLGPRAWSALYQQQPLSEEGGMFKPNWFGYVDQLPERRAMVRAWDLGATSDGDFTVGVLMSRDRDGVFYIEHVIRQRGSALDTERLVLNTAKNDGRNVKISIPQDPGQAGKSQAENYIRRLAGFNVKANRPTGPKVTRAEGFAAQCEARNVKLVRGSWNQSFIDELSTFPLGANDDQVDAAADAFNTLLGPRAPISRDW